MLEAWYLPGLPEAPDEWLEGRTRSGASFRAPALSAAQAAAVAGAVREAVLESRTSRSTDRVIDTVCAAAAKLTAEGPAAAAARELLRTELGWDERLVRETLDGVSRAWTAESLKRLVEEELGGCEVLDRFVDDPGWSGVGCRRRRASGSPVVLQVLAGNVPGLAITATLRALTVRSGVLTKLPADEPGLLPLFARVLSEEDPLLGRCLGATWWPGASFPAAWREWGKWAGKAVVYGGDVTVETARASLTADTEVIAYGPRTGVAVALADGAPGAARGLARDICAYDQQGCVSPRLMYVVGQALQPFVDALAEGLASEASLSPPPDPTTEEAVAIRAARAAFEFGGYAGGETEVRSPGPGLEWTLLVGSAASAQAESLPRVVWVHPVADLEALEDVLRPLENRIQTLGYCGSEGLEKLAALGARLGVSRIAPFGSVAWPPPDWRHEGKHQLVPLVNWTDLELPG